MKQKKITTGSNIRTWFARFLMLTCFLVSFTAAAVADSGFWSSGAANVKISGVWQSELNSGNVNDIDLGSVSTAPIIEQAWAKVWGDGAIDKVYFCYRIDDGTITEVISDDQNLGSGDKAYNWNSLNITLPNTIDSHVVEFWFKTNNDKYLSNNSQNYKIVYEIEGPTMQCDPQNTKVIFRENFDFEALTSETSRCEYRRTLADDGYEAWVPAKNSAGAQGYTYMEACKAMKDNGYYAVVVDPQWGGCGDQSNGDPNACKCEGSKWFRHEKSTSGSGGMLMFNANNGEESTPDILYACKVDVCKNTYINFSAFIAPANAHRPGTGCDGNYNPASVKFVLRNSQTQQILAERIKRNINLDAGWIPLNVTFNSEDAENVTLEFVNIAPNGDCGNDLLIDEITLSVCTPKATLATSNGTEKSTIITGQGEKLSVELLNGIINNPYYFWQYYDPRTKVWGPVENAAALTASAECELKPMPVDTKYRVIIAPTQPGADMNKVLNEILDNLADKKLCGMYAISNEVTVAVKPIEVEVTPAYPNICVGDDVQYTIKVTNPVDNVVSDNFQITFEAPTQARKDYELSAGGQYNNGVCTWNLTQLAKETTSFTYKATSTEAGTSTAYAYVSRVGENTYDGTVSPYTKVSSTININQITFITSPTPSVEACEGSSVTFTAGAESVGCVGEIKYQWVRRPIGSTAAFTAIAGATGTTYTISSLKAADAQYEYAVWANIDGCSCVNVQSSVATITFVPKTTVPTEVNDYLKCQEIGTQQLKKLVEVDFPDNLVFYTTKTGNETVTEFDKNIPISTKYFFTYQETDKCASDRGEVSVEVLATPVAKINDGERQVCAESEYKFTLSATAQNGVGTWEVASVTGGTASIANPNNASTTLTVSAGATANVTWTVVAPNPDCNATASATFIVDKKPEVNYITNKGSQQACATSEFTVAVEEHPGTGLWEFVGEKYNAVIANPTAFETNVSGIELGEKVTLKYTASNGSCDPPVVGAEITLENLICNNLVLDNAVNDGEVCKNEEVIFTISIKNHSSVASTDVKAEVKLPAGLEYIKTIPATDAYNPQTGAWAVGDLAVQAEAKIQIKVKALATSTLTAKILEASSESIDDIKDDATVTVFALPTAAFNTSASEICGSENEKSAIGVTLTGKAPYSLTYTLGGEENTDYPVYSPHSIAQSLTEQKDYQFTLTKVVDANGCEADISGETHTVTVDKYAELDNIKPVDAICEKTALRLPAVPSVTANGSTVSAGKWLLNGIELTSNVLTANDNGKQLKYMVESTCGTKAPKPIYSNEVTVTVDKNPSDAKISLDRIDQCNNPVFAVTAEPITVGKGVWTTVQGEVASILPDNNNVTTVTLTDNYTDSEAKVKWTVSNGACESKSDDIILLNNICNSFELKADGIAPAVCYNSLATFNFTLKNTAKVAVKNVTLQLTADAGLAIQSATAKDYYSFTAGKCVIPNMAADETINIVVTAIATVDQAQVTVEVVKSSNVDVQNVEVSQAVTVFALPTATFTANSSVVCASESAQTAIQVNFTGKPNYVLTYTVDGATTITDPVANPYTIKEPLTTVGTYDIKLVSVEDANGCIGTVNNQVHTTKVEKYATLGNISDVNPICEESTVKLPDVPTEQANGSAINNRKWMLDGTTIDATSVIPYTTEEQKLWYQLQSTCATYTKTIKSNEVTLKVDQKPTVANAGPDQVKCNDGTFTMAANVPTIGTGLWSVEGDAVLNFNKNLYNTSVEGVEEGNSVDFVWTISSKLGKCKASSDKVTLTNNNCADFKLEVNGDPSKVCPDGLADFNFTLTNTASVDVENVKLQLSLDNELTLESAKVGGLWFDNNALTIQEMKADASVNIKVQATASANANNKKVTITVVESSGVSVGMSTSQTVVVNQPPVITEIIPSVKEIVEGESYEEVAVIDCNNTSLILNPVIKDKDGKPYTNPLDYIWNKVDVNGNVIEVGGIGKTETVTTEGDYVLQVVDQVTGCISDKKTIHINQNKTTPVITNIISYTSIDPGTSEEEKTDILTCNNPVLFLFPTVKTDNDVTYQWFKGTETTALSTEVVLKVEEPGVYTLVVTDKVSGCPSAAYPYTIYEKRFYPDLKEIIPTTKPIVADEEYQVVTVLDCNNQSLILNPDVKRADGTVYPADSLVYVWKEVDANGNVIKLVGEGKTQTVTTPGYYELEVVDLETGCPGTKKVIEITQDIITPVITNIISYTKEDPNDPERKESNVLTCANPLLYLNPSADSAHGVTYLWSTGDTTKVLKVDVKGTYSLVVTDTITGCVSAKFEYEITENKKTPVVEKIIPSTTENMDDENYKETSVLDCNNPELILTPVIKDADGNPYAAEDIIFIWSTKDEEGNVTVIGEGKTQKVTDKNTIIVQVVDKETGCLSEEKEIKITEDYSTPIITNIISYTKEDLDAPESTQSSVLTCANPVLYLNPSVDSANDVTYLWSTGDTTKVLKVEEPNTYSLIVTDVKTGCVSEKIDFVVTQDKETIALTLNDVALCPIDTLSSITLSGLMPKLDGVTYAFFDANLEPIADLYDAPERDEERTYYASAISSNGCSSDTVAFNIDFVVLPDFTIEVSESPVLAGGNQSVVTVIPTDADMTIDSYQWMANGKELQVEDTEYVANLYLDTKFVVTASNRCGAISKEAQVIVVWPTAFTPYNKNGMNETFAKGLPLAVFNRFGIQVYEGQDGWDGVMNMNMGKDELAVPGVYYYAVQLPDGNVKKGTIEIVKF